MRMSKKDAKQRVKDISVRTFTICSCPESVYDRFIDFCNKNSKNIRYYKDKSGKLHKKEEVIYHIGLRLLLDIADSDAKSMMLYEKIKHLRDRVDLIEKKLQSEKDNNKSKTFGGDKNDK